MVGTVSHFFFFFLRWYQSVVFHEVSLLPDKESPPLLYISILHTSCKVYQQTDTVYTPLSRFTLTNPFYFGVILSEFSVRFLHRERYREFCH